MKSGNTKTYSFKSVGQLATTAASIEQLQNVVTPLSIQTPVRFGGAGGAIFKMHTELLSSVKDNLRNLIVTNHGERMVHYDFGANLLELATEMGTEEADTLAMQRIAKAVGKYMPFVDLNSFESFTNHTENQSVAQVGIRLTYSVPVLGVSNLGIETIISSV